MSEENHEFNHISSYVKMLPFFLLFLDDMQSLLGLCAGIITSVMMVWTIKVTMDHVTFSFILRGSTKIRHLPFRSYSHFKQSTSIFRDLRFTILYHVGFSILQAV